MSLQQRLDRMRTKYEAKLDPETLAVMHRATDELLRTGIMAGVLKKGDQAPVFALPDQGGNRIDSAALLERGPLVVGFYRGVW